MREDISVGIHGIGVFLPKEVRTNDWWPENVVARWTARRAFVPGATPNAAIGTEGERRAMTAMAELGADPFQGCRQRCIMPDGMLASVMEKAAAEEAIANAGIDAREIGLLLCHTSVPDDLITNNACLLHHRLGLPARCMSVATDVACNGFLLQLALAEQMIKGGQARYALIVQSSSVSRLMPMDEPHSSWFGDACTAAVVGPVEHGRGIRGRAHRTDGSLHRAVVAGVRGRRWYEDGRVQVYAADPTAAHRMFLELADIAKEVSDDAFAEAACTSDQIAFYAPHQGTAWLRRVTQEHIGLSRAKGVDTFPWAANVVSANIPLALSIGQKEGLLKDDDLVLLFCGGAGITYSSIVLRWGR